MTAPGSSYPLPAQHPFTGLDAWRLLSLRAAADPAAPFLTWHPFEGDGRTWSYGAFARDALAVAAGLRGRGVRAGDRVLIHLENCPEFLLAWYGAGPGARNPGSACSRNISTGTPGRRRCATGAPPRPSSYPN